MVRHGYIYPLKNGKVCNRCPIVFTNSEYIYFVYNGDKRLHFVNTHSWMLITPEKYYQMQTNSPRDFLNTTYYVIVGNSESFDYDGDLIDCNLKIQRYHNLLVAAKQALDSSLKQMQECQKEIEDRQHSIADIEDALDNFYNQQATIERLKKIKKKK